MNEFTEMNIVLNICVALFAVHLGLLVVHLFLSFRSFDVELRFKSLKEDVLRLEADQIDRSGKLERKIETYQNHVRDELGGIKKVIDAMYKNREGNK